MKRRDFLRGVSSLGLAALADWRAFAADAGLPSYYGDYLAGVARKVRDRAAEGRDAFWFITDPHVPCNRKMSGRVLAKLIGETGVGKVFCGGDIPEAFGKRENVERAMADFRKFWIEPIEAAGGRFYLAKGNHDFTIRESMESADGFTLDARAASDFILNTRAAKASVRNADDPEGCYFYIDEPKSKIRYVVADTTDSITTSRTFWAVENGVHERQLNWLRKEAFGTLPAGYELVVVHHIPITGVVGSDAEAKTFANFRGLLNQHADRMRVDLTGHVHLEAQTFQRGFWHVTEPCDAAYADYINGSLPWCPNLPRKSAGTVFENTFDAVILLPDGRDLAFIRVGGGADRLLHGQPITLGMGKKRLFASRLKNVRWGCYDAARVGLRPDPSNRWGRLREYYTEVAAIDAQGVLTARKSGESVVVAMASDGRKEMFPVKCR